MGVRYKLVPGFPAYRVGTDGSVWSRAGLGCKPSLRPRWQPLKTNLTTRGYPYVNLGKGKPRAVHVLVLTAFRGQKPTGFEARHLNGIKTDCRLRNLKWGTPQENAEDRIRHGTANGAKHPVQGVNHPNAKLNENIVRQIRGSNEPQKQLAARYGVAPSLVWAVRAGRVWRHVA